MTKILLILLAATGLLSCICSTSYPIATTPLDTNPLVRHKSPPKPPASPFIGLTEAEAGLQADRQNVPHRVVSRDGESFPMTMDYSESRLNFTIANGRVIQVTKG